MRLPAGSGVIRTTTSSVKPNQKVVAVASIRPSFGCASTMSQPIAWAAASAREGGLGACGEDGRLDVRIGLALLLGDLRPSVGKRLLELRRLLGIGSDVVDPRRRPCALLDA